jgi:hypothetical protein
MEGRSAICERKERLTRQHLIPRTRHSNKWNKREFDRVMVRTVAGICRPCHSQIHQILNEKELEREFNTIQKLPAHPEIAKLTIWIRSKPAGFRAAMRHSKVLRMNR